MDNVTKKRSKESEKENKGKRTFFKRRHNSQETLKEVPGSLDIQGINFCSNCGSKLSEGSKFCSNCGYAIQQYVNEIVAKKQRENQVQLDSRRDRSMRHIEYVGKVYKCPNCGEKISPIISECSACGHKITNLKDREELENFMKKMMALESNRKDGILNIYREIFAGEKSDIVALIRNYPVPDSIDVMLEFMIYANTHIEGSRNRSEELAWVEKMKQIYKKAKITCSKDKLFVDIKNLYKECEENYS